MTGLQVAAVAAEPVALVRELAGSVRAATVSQVSARIMAQALTVPVAEGDAVSKGQLLAELDDRELQAKARQAESGLRQAEAGLKQAQAQRDLAAATHARFQALLEGRAVSRQEYEQVAAQEAVAQAAVAQAESAVAQATSAVEEASTWLGFAELRAPVAGRVVARRIDPGSMATPGAPLFTIEQEGRLRVEVPVDGALSGAVARGTPLAVRVDAAGFDGEVPVTEVVAAADPVSRTFLVKADLPAGPGLRSGQFARVTRRGGRARGGDGAGGGARAARTARRRLRPRGATGGSRTGSSSPAARRRRDAARCSPGSRRASASSSAGPSARSTARASPSRGRRPCRRPSASRGASPAPS